MAKGYTKGKGGGKGGARSGLASAAYGERINASDFVVGDLMIIKGTAARITNVTKKSFSYIDLSNNETATMDKIETVFVPDNSTPGWYKPPIAKKVPYSTRKLGVEKTRSVMRAVKRQYGEDSSAARAAQNILDRLK